jgi:hypothetical protein
MTAQCPEVSARWSTNLWLLDVLKYWQDGTRNYDCWTSWNINKMEHKIMILNVLKYWQDGTRNYDYWTSWSIGKMKHKIMTAERPEALARWYTKLWPLNVLKQTWWDRSTVKLSLCLINWSPRHKDVSESAGIARSLFISALEFQALMALSPKKESPVPIGGGMPECHNRFGRYEERNVTLAGNLTSTV